MKKAKTNKPFHFTARIAKRITATFSWGGGIVISCEWSPYQPHQMSRQMKKRYDIALETATALMAERIDNPPKPH